MKRNMDLYDEDLLLLMHQGNISASEEFFNRYKYYSWRLAYDFNTEHPNSGIAIEDYHQIAFACLPRAISNFIDLKMNFYGYWKKIAEHEMVAYFKENSYYALSICDLPSFGEDEDSVIIGEEENYLDRTAVNKIYRDELKQLVKDTIAKFKKDSDKEIINLFIDEYSFDEIRKKTKQDQRHIRYVINRFSSLFQQILKKRNYN